MVHPVFLFPFVYCAMKEILEVVSNKLDNPVIIVLTLIVLFFLYITKEAWIKKISSITAKDLKKAIGKKPYFQYAIKDLEKHDLFVSDIPSYRDYRYDFYTHGQLDETKSKIFTDFLNVKMDSTKDNMLKISKKAKDEMSRVDLKNHINKCFNSCNECLENNLETLFITNGLTQEMSKVIIYKFYAVRRKAMERYNRRIDSIFACDFYESNFQIILAVYEVVAYEMDDIIEDSIQTFKEINGLFLNLEYGK